MFGLFRKKIPNKCPVTEENRVWLEDSFHFLLDLFDREKVKTRKQLIPHHSDFPIRYLGNAETAFSTMEIVAKQMEVLPQDIHLDFYDHGMKAISTGGPFGNRIFLETEKDKSSAGLYWGRQEDNKYHIWLERKKLKQPENMVAVLAHEIAHIKLLGEKRIENNDEKLTDLVTIIFGLGIFNANAAFQSYSGFDSSGWQKTGYLTQMEWGYALALFAWMRGEQAPGWTEHLSLNVKGDFKRGELFIRQNEHFIFQRSK